MENKTERRDFIGVTSGWLHKLRGWIDARFPMSKLWNEQVAQYYAPKNFNFWYFFGSIALRLPIALGTDVLLGCASEHFVVGRHYRYQSWIGAVAPR